MKAKKTPFENKKKQVRFFVNMGFGFFDRINRIWQDYNDADISRKGPYRRARDRWGTGGTENSKVFLTW